MYGWLSGSVREMGSCGMSGQQGKETGAGRGCDEPSCFLIDPPNYWHGDMLPL